MPTKQEMLDKIYEVIADKSLWHPVMIWDVLDFVEKQDKPIWWYLNLACSIIAYFNYLRKPIDDQTIECIEYVYNLCK